MQNYNIRKMTDPGSQRTNRWLSDWFVDPDEQVRVERIKLPCVDVPRLPLPERAEYDAFRSGNQSELHSYLKFTAYRWLLKTSAYPETARSEVTCYFPIEELCEGIRARDADGSELDIRTPQVLPEGSLFPLHYGESIRADLHCTDISVEIGGTHPFNLIMPVAAGLSYRALWIPYPDGTAPGDFDLQNWLGIVNGYLVDIVAR